MSNVASLCSGSPTSWISIVTSAAWQPLAAPLGALQPATGLTEATRPTLMPAIRTSEFGPRPFAWENSAWTVNLLANGFANFV